LRSFEKDLLANSWIVDMYLERAFGGGLRVRNMEVIEVLSYGRYEGFTRDNISEITGVLENL
jgi:hypothetical protein